MNRKKFIKNAVSLSVLPFVPSFTFGKDVNEEIIVENMERPKVIFCDVNETLLDLEPLKMTIVKHLDGKDYLGTLWFTTMLQYSLVVSASNQYFDFGKIGIATLQMIAKNNNIPLSTEDATNAVKQILSLKPHPEVVEALQILKQNGYKLVTFTNSSNYAIAQQLKNAGLNTVFDSSISVEDFGKFKPDNAVYHWAARKMNIENKDCLLIAAHGWDIAGAIWAGWKTAFIERKGQQLFPLSPLPNMSKPDLLQIANELIKL